MPYLDKILQEISDERKYQQERWGDEFDAKNTPNDWLAYILSYAGKAVTLKFNAEQFRISLIKTATLCAAAIEWCDKTNGKMAKRHYD